MSSIINPAGRTPPWRLASGRTPGLFLLGYGLAAAIAIAASIRVFLSGDPTASGPVLLTALITNFFVIVGLSGFVALRVARLARGRRRDDPAPRLHLRVVGFLTFAAILPAFIVAVFVGGVFVRVLDDWFDARVGGTLENMAAVANAYLAEEGAATRDELRATAFDLNQPEVAAALGENRIRYVSYLRNQAAARGFPAAYIIDGTGAVLARAELTDDVAYAPPTPAEFERADRFDIPWTLDRETGRIRLLYRLAAYDSAYLHVVRDLNRSIVSALNRAETSLVSYREAADHRGRAQFTLLLLYIQATFLVVVGGAWLGVSAANRLIAPIGRLVRAAERVRDGHYDARVVVSERRDELALLGRAFNEMTEQLKSQRRELLDTTAEAEERRRFTEAVLAGVSAGVLGVDAAGRVTIANRSALALLDADEAGTVGADVAIAAPELDRFVREARAAADGVVEGQVALERAGLTRTLNVRAAARGDSEGSVVVTFDDISRLVSAQRNAAWRDVARRIAHEIKNPLTPIQLSAERLRRKYGREIATDPDVFERCTDTIVRQVSDIGRMVDEFSSFARMPEPKMERVELGEVVRSAVFAQRVATPDIACEAAAPDAPVFATCDERLVAQALAIVLKYAAEAIATRMAQDPGGKGPSGRIDVVLETVDERAAIIVEDNGAGWPATARERLVEPYMTTREKGTGLGLAIVRRVMEDHHGALELADRRDGGEGAGVRLVLPLDVGVVETTRTAAARAEA